jgi:ribosomal protein L19E
MSICGCGKTRVIVNPNHFRPVTGCLTGAPGATLVKTKVVFALVATKDQLTNGLAASFLEIPD